MPLKCSFCEVFVYTGPGTWSVVGFGGRGARLWRHPGKVLQMSLGLKHFVLEGVM